MAYKQSVFLPVFRRVSQTVTVSLVAFPFFYNDENAAVAADHVTYKINQWQRVPRDHREGSTFDIVFLLSSGWLGWKSVGVLLRDIYGRHCGQTIS